MSPAIEPPFICPSCGAESVDDGTCRVTTHKHGCTWDPDEPQSISDDDMSGSAIEPPVRFHDEIDWENLPCALHNVLEPHQDGSIWCPECWHNYWDNADLIATELTEWASMYEGRPAPVVSDIMCCPLCVHDW